MKQFVTFGQIHHHVIEGVVFDKDCVATFEAEDHNKGREKAFQLFGQQFSFHYTEDTFRFEDQLQYFPRGLIEVPERTLIEELQNLADLCDASRPTSNWPGFHAARVLQRAITAIRELEAEVIAFTEPDDA